MNDALWRAKRMDMDWIATIDIDEYVTLYNGTKVEGNSLKEYFESVEKSRLGFNISSVQMESLPYGNKFNIKKKEDLEIDYIYRNNVSLEGKFPGGREKHFLHVKHVSAVNTHYIKENGSMHNEIPRILRINHYRLPQDGIFKGSHNIAEDTLLRDSFRDAIQNDIRSEVAATSSLS